MLGDDVVAVQEEFDARCDQSTHSISIPQAQKAISALLGGVIPGECRTVLGSLGRGQEFELTFSELCILFAEKFYFHALKTRENGMKKEMAGLLVRARNAGAVGREEDDADEQEEIEANMMASSRRETSAARGTLSSSVRNVDAAISGSILDEAAEFRNKVNAAFRRFDVYGTDPEAESKEIGEDEDAEAGGYILLEDAPDALVACGLPIEREEAENLVIDLASNSLSSEFQGFTKAEFVLVCRRILSIFQEEEGEGGGGGGGGGGRFGSPRSARK